MKKRHASLFSGIGGFDLAAQWMGWENVFQVEKDKRCLDLLARRFHNTKRFDDVKTFSPTTHGFNNTIDILTGGDPCQPHSIAGLGKGTKDDRFLWPEMLRIAYELNVPWIVNENVSGSIANGVLDLKIDDLESIGYACQAYCIPAESVGALHQRERVWLIAYNAYSDRSNQIARAVLRDKERAPGVEAQQHEIHQPWQPVDLRVFSSDSNTERLQELNHAAIPNNGTEGHARNFGFGPAPHGNIPRHIIESGIMGMLNGLPEGMDYADRGQRIKGTGNAIVPEVAYELFKAIDKIKFE